jgi:hypothetical protein
MPGPGGNFHPTGSNALCGQFQPLQLGQLLVSRRQRTSILEHVRVYRGRPEPDRQAKSATANDRQTTEWTRSSKLSVIRRPLRYPSNWPDSPPGEKGIDVAIAVDIVRLAMEKAYDAAILVSSDADLLPAIETLHDLRLAHLETASWRGAYRIRLSGGKLPWCHQLSEQDYQSVMDLTDYTK